MGRDSKNFYIADTHFGHANAIRFDGRPFETIEEHDKTIMANWNSVVRDDDHVYILGDFAYKNEKDVSYYTNKLNGKLHLIRGNHDKRTPEYELCFKSVDDVLKVSDVANGTKQTVVLCHYWMPFVGQKKIMLYGHTHMGDEYVLEVLLQDELRRNNYPQNAYNVGCMHIGYYPRTLEEILQGWF